MTATRDERDLHAAYQGLTDEDALARLNRFVDDLATTPAARPTVVRRLVRPAPLLAAAVVLAVAITVAALQFGSRPTKPAAGRSASPQSSDTPTGPDWSEWAGFPVDASPRPIVLTGPSVSEPASGYPTGGDKLAFSSGNFALDATLPKAPKTQDGQPIAPASDAVAALKRFGSGRPAGTPLRIVAVRLTSSSFSTDRGARSLPAWEFTFAGVSDPAYVLAIPAADRWPHGTVPQVPGLTLVHIAGDDRHVTLTFIGSAPGTGPCETEYAARSTETTTVVAIDIEATTTGNAKGGSPQACTTIGYRRSVTVTLHRPLGNRVLINPSGVPLPVR